MDFSKEPIHHMYYKDHFNAVDRLDNELSQQDFCYGVDNYRTKIMLTLFTFLVVNSYSIFRQIAPMDLYEFRRKIANKLWEAPSTNKPGKHKKKQNFTSNNQ